MIKDHKEEPVDDFNSNWRKNYNAFLVSALVADNEAKSYTVLGALCVDNFKGNFDDRITHNILASIIQKKSR